MQLAEPKIRAENPPNVMKPIFEKKFLIGPVKIPNIHHGALHFAPIHRFMVCHLEGVSGILL